MKVMKKQIPNSSNSFLFRKSYIHSKIPTDCPQNPWGFITVPIPIPYPYPWESPYPRQPWKGGGRGWRSPPRRLAAVSAAAERVLGRCVCVCLWRRSLRRKDESNRGCCSCCRCCLLYDDALGRRIRCSAHRPQLTTDDGAHLLDDDDDDTTRYIAPCASLILRTTLGTSSASRLYRTRTLW